MEFPFREDSSTLINDDLEAGRITKIEAGLRLAQLAQGKLELIEAGTGVGSEVSRKIVGSIIKEGMGVVSEKRKK